MWNCLLTQFSKLPLEPINSSNPAAWIWCKSSNDECLFCTVLLLVTLIIKEDIRFQKKNLVFNFPTAIFLNLQQNNNIILPININRLLIYYLNVSSTNSSYQSQYDHAQNHNLPFFKMSFPVVNRSVKYWI